MTSTRFQMILSPSLATKAPDALHKGPLWMRRICIRIFRRAFFFEKHVVPYSMAHADRTLVSSRKTWATAIVIWVFLCIWLTGMTAGLMAGACRQDRYEGEKKLRFCNISLVAAASTKILPIERAKGSIIQLERGIALMQIGRDKYAVAAFAKAIQDSRAKQGRWEKQLHSRVFLAEDERLLSLWHSALKRVGRP